MKMFTLLVLLGLVCVGSSIRCYTCAGDASCADPFDGIYSTPVECDEGITQCMKTRAEVFDIVAVSRSCGTNSSNEADGCKKSEIAIAKAQACFCSTDGCNTATFVSGVSILLLFASATIACIFQ